MDWSQCIICQKATEERLLCPARSKRTDYGAGYRTVADDLMQFSQIHQLPPHLTLSRIDEGRGIAESLSNHDACWHKSCRDKYNKTKLGRLMKRKTVDDDDSQESGGIARNTRASHTKAAKESCLEKTCFFCEEVSFEEHLTEACTFGLDQRVRGVALQLGDTKLLAKLSAGDMIATEAVYHKRCLIALYNRARATAKASDKDDTDAMIHGIVFAELVAFIQDAKLNESCTPVFKLSDLAKDYAARIEQMAIAQCPKVHTGRLKEKLLAHIPNLRAYTKGKEVMMGFDDDVGNLLSNVCQKDADADAICLAQASRVVRKELFKEQPSFNGTFPPKCQDNSVPPLLLALVNMILEGPSIRDQSANNTRQAGLSIAQLMKFNSVKHRRHETGSTKHSKDMETPLPIYIGTMLHTNTRKRELVDRFHNLGLSVSYDRVLRISAGIANAVCERFTADQVVCPPRLLGNVFTTAAVDNIDHNPSSTTATGSFHGTGISLIQHPSFNGQGQDMGHVVITDSSSTKCVKPLPSAYTNVHPVSMSTQKPPVPPLNTNINFYRAPAQKTIEDETQWLKKVLTTTRKDRSVPTQEDTERANAENSESNDIHAENAAQDDRNARFSLSWSAYHADHQKEDNKPLCSSSLLPLFTDSAHTVAMIRHSMTVIQQCLHHINPQQTPVLVFDQPLFALAKEIQWTFPEQVGESKMVIVLGGLHIEMAALKVLGSWLDGSGWTDALVDANVTTSGRSDSLLHASHITRTRYAHQVTAATLYQLKQSAYEKYQTLVEGDALQFDDWCDQRCEESPQFHYWSLTLDLEILVLILVRSFRESDFDLYLTALTQLTPWFFALDKIHYSRWVPIHLRDMLELQYRHPTIHKEFMDGHFTVQKTTNAFSAIDIDQAHEQNNELVKGDGGAIGLTENPSALLRWMVAGPEMARMVKEFEDSNVHENVNRTPHHEQTASHELRFKGHVKSLFGTMDKLGNPFEEESGDLLSLTSKDIADSSVCETVKNIKALGNKQYQEFTKERLITRSQPFYDKISLNKLPLLSSSPAKPLAKDKMKLLSAKNDCSLFSKLYIGCQNRDGNLDDFFCHENQGCPPSISDGGTLRSGNKSDLLQCLDKLSDVTETDPHVTALILDGAAIVQMIKPTGCKTFLQYSENAFLPYLSKWLNKVDRLDLVWDKYISGSLKASTRAKRGKGTRRRVLPSVAIPSNWQNFLRSDDNKIELFKYLSEEVSKVETANKTVIASYGSDVLSYPALNDKSRLSPCSHEEADTRIMVHVADAVEMGHKSIMIRTVDTDVVVLAVSVARALALEELWIAFGTGKACRMLPAHSYASALGHEKSQCLPIFHAMTGSDTTSFFCGHGKKTAWVTWEMFPSVTDAFLDLTNCPADVSPECLATLERYIALLYDRTTDINKVNDLRRYLFTKKGRMMEGLPPTEAALIQHIRRAIYQGGYIWGQCLKPEQILPDVTEWGWVKEGQDVKPRWTTLPEAAKSCFELLHCGCKSGCANRCKCVKASLPCTPLCMCDGQCIWNS